METENLSGTMKKLFLIVERMKEEKFNMPMNEDIDGVIMAVAGFNDKTIRNYRRALFGMGYLTIEKNNNVYGSVICKFNPNPNKKEIVKKEGFKK